MNMGNMDMARQLYWRKTLRLTLLLLVLGFCVTLLPTLFAAELNRLVVWGFPVGFYMAAQGTPVVYLLIVWYYARRMKALDTVLQNELAGAARSREVADA